MTKPRALCTLILFAAACSALSDVTVRMEMSMSAGSRSNASIKSTMWVKDHMSKVESNTSTMIIDMKSKTVTTLNPSTKTYTQAPMGKTAPKMDVTLSGKVQTTKEVKTILGMKAKKYIADVSIVMGKDSAKPLKMKIEVWATEEVNVPKEALAAGNDFLSGMGLSGSGGSLSAFKKEMEKIKGLALLTTTTMEMPGASGSSQSFSMVMKVTNVDKGMISRNVFDIPKGYTKKTA